jgi:hypothetical protein
VRGGRARRAIPTHGKERDERGTWRVYGTAEAVPFEVWGGERLSRGGWDLNPLVSLRSKGDLRETLMWLGGPRSTFSRIRRM